MISYLSIIYKSLEYMNHEHYHEAEKLLLHGISCLQRLYDDNADQSVNKGDKDVEKIEICMYYTLAKNYFNRANHCLEHFDYRNDANEKLSLCFKATEKQTSLIKTYPDRKKHATLFNHIELENKYIAILGKLSVQTPRGASRNIEKEIQSINNELKDKYRF